MSSTEVVVTSGTVPGYWGRGENLAEAKKSFTKFGGRLSNGYVVYAFGPAIEFTGITDLGTVQWRTRDGSDYDPKDPEHQPVISEHPARNKG